MQNAFYMGVIIALPTALLSCFLVLKGWALMGDAVSHAVLPGIVSAHILGLPLIVGAFVAGMICAVASGFISENSRLKRDTVMGVVFSGMYGFGIVLYLSIDTSLHLDHILFGNLLGVGSDEIWMGAGISLIVIGFILMKLQDLLLHSFDPGQAKALGLPVWFLHYGLLSALSLTIVATLSATGLILAIGLMVAPGAIGFMLTRRFHTMILVSISACLFAMAVGIYLSFWLDSAPAPTVVLVLTTLFVGAFGFRMWRNHDLELSRSDASTRGT